MASADMAMAIAPYPRREDSGILAGYLGGTADRRTVADRQAGELLAARK
jgi:hypothetical protein